MLRSSNLVLARRFTKLSTVTSFNNEVPLATHIDDLPTETKFLGLIDLGMMRYPTNKFHLFFGERAKKLGDMFCFQPFRGAKKILVIQDPGLMREVVSKEGETPERGDIGFQMLKKALAELNLHDSLVTSDGPAWKRMRDPLTKRFHRPKSVSNYIPDLSNIADKAVRDIIEMSKKDFDLVRNSLLNWSFFSIHFFLFNKHLESYDSDEIKKLGDAVKITISNTLSTKWNKPHLKYLPSKDWREFTASIQFATDFIRKQLKEVGNAPSNTENDTFLDYLMNEMSFDTESIVALILDLTLAAVDTTKYAVQWLWYNLAKNPQVQDKLYTELNSVLGDSKVITVEQFSKLKYLKMCVNESLRVSPLVALLARVIKQEDTIGEVKVPKDTLVMINSYAMSQDERYWKDSKEFIPERWESKNEIDFFSYLPFGTGPRMCAGKRLAETQIQLITAHMCRQARIHLECDPTPTFESLLLPRGLKLSFEQRKV